MNSNFTETDISNDKTIIGVIYSMPNNNLQKFLEHCDKTLSQIKDSKIFIITTDQNRDLFKVESHERIAELLNCICLLVPSYQQ